MHNEYRMFIINGRVAATTPCFRNTTPLNAWLNGRFDPRLCDGHNAIDATETPENRIRVAKYARFARQFCNDMAKTHPNTKNYVLDVAWSDQLQDVVSIEINSITWAGAYQLNMFRLCSAIANKPYRYEDIFNNLNYNFFQLKNEAWNQMKLDNIITTQQQSLNGFDRTLKAGTLSQFKQFI
jgi:hypothetical protein